MLIPAFLAFPRYYSCFLFLVIEDLFCSSSCFSRALPSALGFQLFLEKYAPYLLAIFTLSKFPFPLDFNALISSALSNGSSMVGGFVVLEVTSELWWMSWEFLQQNWKPYYLQNFWMS